MHIFYILCGNLTGSHAQLNGPLCKTKRVVLLDKVSHFVHQHDPFCSAVKAYRFGLYFKKIFVSLCTALAFL